MMLLIMRRAATTRTGTVNPLPPFSVFDLSQIQFMFSPHESTNTYEPVAEDPFEVVVPVPEEVDAPGLPTVPPELKARVVLDCNTQLMPPRTCERKTGSCLEGFIKTHPPFRRYQEGSNACLPCLVQMAETRVKASPCSARGASGSLLVPSFEVRSSIVSPDPHGGQTHR